MVCSGTGELGQCWTMGRWCVVETCVALGLETGSLCDYILVKHVIVVWDCETIG